MKEDERKDEKRKDEKKQAGKNIDPATTGSQIGMGGSEGLGGSHVQGAGNESGMSSVSSSYESLPDKGTGSATGSRARKGGTETGPEK